MPNYKYRATAMSGKMVRGTLAASDPEALLNELKKKDLFLLDYTQTSKTSFGSKLKAKELTDFCRQLGSLLDAGVSVIQSFNIISNRASISKFARNHHRPETRQGVVRCNGRSGQGVPRTAHQYGACRRGKR